jgi:hypothetical protein
LASSPLKAKQSLPDDHFVGRIVTRKNYEIVEGQCVIGPEAYALDAGEDYLSASHLSFFGFPSHLENGKAYKASKKNWDWRKSHRVVVHEARQVRRAGDSSSPPVDVISSPMLDVDPAYAKIVNTSAVQQQFCAEMIRSYVDIVDVW